MDFFATTDVSQHAPATGAAPAVFLTAFVGGEDNVVVHRRGYQPVSLLHQPKGPLAQRKGIENCLVYTQMLDSSCTQAVQSMRVNALTWGQMFAIQAINPARLRRAILQALVSPAKTP